EAYSGTLLWLLRYPQDTLSSPVNYEDSERVQQWYNNPIIIQDDLLLLAPPDSPQIMAVNRFSGKIIWRRDRFNSEEKKLNSWNLRYLLGVAEGKVFLSGDILVALELTTGKIVWKTSETDLRIKPFGRGILSARYIYIPYDDALYRISIEGVPTFTYISKEKEKWKWAKANTVKGGGNLLMWNGALLVVSETNLSVFFDFQQTEQLLEQSIQKDPQNLQNLFRLASLYLQSQNFLKAEEYFLKVRTLASQTKAFKLEQNIHNGLYKTYIAKADQERRFAKKIPLYQEALKEAISIQEEMPIYLAMIDLYKSNREKNNVIDTWKLLFEKYGNQDYSFFGESVKIAPYVLDQLAKYYFEQNEGVKGIACYQQILENYPKEILQYQDGASFAERQIKLLIQQFGKAIYAEQEQKAKALFVNAQKRDQIESYYRLLKLYPNSEIREQCQFALIEKMVKEQTFSEDLLIHIKSLLQNYPQSPLQHQFFFYLFQTYYRQGKITQAKNTLRILSKQYAQKQVCWENKTVLIEQWLQTLQDERLKDFGQISQEIELVLSENPSLYTWLQRLSNSETLSLLLAEGIPPDSYGSCFYALNGNTLYCFNAHQSNPNPVWVKGLTFKPEKLIYQKNSLILLGKENEMSLSLKEITEEWKFPFSATVKDMIVYPDLFATVYEEKNFFWLSLMDTKNGQKLENPIEICKANNLNPKLYATQDFIVVGTRAPVRYYVYSLASMTLQTIIEGRNFHPLGETLLLEPNLLFFLDKEIVGSEENSVIKAYDLSRTGAKAEPLWVNTKFSKLLPLTLTGKGDTVGIQQEGPSGHEKRQLISLDAQTGAIRWQYPELLNSISAVLWDWDYIYFMTLEVKSAKISYRVVCLRTKDGELVWKSSQLPGPANSIRFKNTKNYLGCHLENENPQNANNETYFLLFDKETGKMIRKYELSGKNHAEGIVIDTALVLVKDSTIYSYTSK
ncbi:MAG: PQQ-binding-like beta-propeller repeat protein, partial [Planctomycetota bacterium]